MSNQLYNFTIFPLLEPQQVLEDCEGNNKKGLFIALNTIENAVLELPLLEKILSAIQYDLKQDTLLYKCTPKDAWKFINLAKKTKIQHLLSFGIPPKNMGLMHQVKLYEPIQVGETKILFVHPLHQIAQDKTLKGNLWNTLKAMFL